MPVIFIHYSQPSIQADWLLESTVDGSTWLRRFSSFEAEHNHQALVRECWLKAFQDLGYSPQFLSSAQIETGALREQGDAVLVLAGSWALSDKEAEEIRAFYASASGALRGIFCDGSPGLFDGHAKLRKQGALEAIFSVAAAGTARAVVAGRESNPAPGDIGRYAADRLKAALAPAWPDWLGRQLSALPPAVSLPATARVRVHRFSVARGQLVAFERNITYQMSEELKQAGGTEALEKPVELEAALSQPAHVYDLRTQRYLGHVGRLCFSLDPWQPSVFALTQDRLPAEGIVAALSDLPSQSAPGQ